MSKTRPYIKYYSEDTVGDGNCAYNAFILGLCNEDVFNQIEANLVEDKLTAEEAFPVFIEKAALALGVAETWAAVRGEALRLRQQDSIALQKKLAPVMRELSVDLLAEETGKEYIQRALYRKNAAYKQYKQEKKHKPNLPHQENPFTPELQRQLVAAFDKFPKDSREDIFKRHPFIVAKFKELKDDAVASAKDKVRHLKKWWMDSGFKGFQSEMKKNGNFAGDIELKQVVNYFRYIKWQVIAPRFDAKRPVVLHAMKRELLIPNLTYAKAQELAARAVSMGVGMEKDFDAHKPLSLLPVTKNQMVANLSAVPNHAEVKAYLEVNKPKNGTPIPSEWKKIPACEEQLELRGVIHRGKFNADCSVPATLKVMLQRIDEIPAKDEILAETKRRSNIKEIELTSANPNAVHWSNVKVTSFASKDEFKAKQKDAEAAKEKAKEEAKKAAAEKAIAEKAEKKAAAEIAAAEKEAKKAAENQLILAKKESKAAGKEFITSTLKYLKTTAAKPEESKWKTIIEKAEAGDKNIEYALAGAVKVMEPASTENVADVVFVTKKTQVALDAELAKGLQKQEYAVYRNARS